MEPRMRVFALLIAFGSCGLGCFAQAGGYVETESNVIYDASPTLVAVEPGIWVVSRQPTTIYYVNDIYWTYRGGTWYRSSTWSGGWISADVNIVPVTIVRRDSRRYVYYDAPRGAPTRALPPGHRATPGVRRGHAHDERKPKNNEMSSTWSGDDRAHHKHEKRGRGRGR
jgi:hypothetical protein